ncbi:TIGR00282 family metallophosphoesterase [Victivallis sp. Marseille-Q1083]|uniref:TIGR00282 family metallophosphoesterase n=1 Tax=Victivallis sp. Marseille-Q1083 TaxID=2717288 RepID=UPI00158BA4AE|nr:TIGR00282 family metallophosphoesterase [Victivallis sp. Marseille-Q1083]
MNLLFIGDVVGKGGREAVRMLVPELRREFNVSFVIVNAENSAAGSGLTAGCLRDLGAAADVYTAGDHVWDQKMFEQEIVHCDNVLRPANLSKLQPGRGFGVFRNPLGGSVAVIVLQGKGFMRESAYCPFETVENILRELPAPVKTIIVDFHAEATSEKIAMGYFLDGKVTAVFGTHTHVPTADARVLPGGTAYLTDVGMVGGVESVLGREVGPVLQKFRTGMPGRLPVVEENIRLDGVIVSYDQHTGRATAVKNFSRIWNSAERNG